MSTNQILLVCYGLFAWLNLPLGFCLAFWVARAKLSLRYFLVWMICSLGALFAWLIFSGFDQGSVSLAMKLLPASFVFALSPFVLERLSRARAGKSHFGSRLIRHGALLFVALYFFAGGFWNLQLWRSISQENHGFLEVQTELENARSESFRLAYEKRDAEFVCRWGLEDHGTDLERSACFELLFEVPQGLRRWSLLSDLFDAVFARKLQSGEAVRLPKGYQQAFLQMQIESYFTLSIKESEARLHELRVVIDFWNQLGFDFVMVDGARRRRLLERLKQFDDGKLRGELKEDLGFLRTILEQP